MKKIIAFIATTMIVSCCAVASASAADKITFELDAASTETSKTMYVYYDGDATQIEMIGAMDIDFTDTVKQDTISMASDLAGASLDLYDGSTYTFSTAANLAAKPTDGRLKIATISFEVPAGAEEFTITNTYIDASSYVNGVGTISLVYNYDGAEDTITPASLTIPKWSTGGDTKDNFTEVAATKGSRYDEHTNTVPVDAWSTKIDWSKYNAVAKLFWSISNGSETKKVEATMAEVTGDINYEVTYGLAIAGQADELNTITEVKLVVE